MERDRQIEKGEGWTLEKVRGGAAADAQSRLPSPVTAAKLRVSIRPLPLVSFCSRSVSTRNCPGSMSMICRWPRREQWVSRGPSSETARGQGGWSTHGLPLVRPEVILLNLVGALDDLVFKPLAVLGRHGDADAHPGALNGKGRRRLQDLDTFQSL